MLTYFQTPWETFHPEDQQDGRAGKASSLKPHDPSSSPRTHIEKGESQLLKAVF